MFESRIEYLREVRLLDDIYVEKTRTPRFYMFEVEFYLSVRCNQSTVTSPCAAQAASAKVTTTRNIRSVTVRY